MTNHPELFLNNRKYLEPHASIHSFNHCLQMINELQHAKGFTLSRIAKRCGVAPSTIRNIASGVVKTPRPILLRKILILHCKVFTETDNEKDNITASEI